MGLAHIFSSWCLWGEQSEITQVFLGDAPGMRSLSAEVWWSKTQQWCSNQQPHSCLSFWKGRVCVGAGCENLSCFSSRWMVQSCCSCRSTLSSLCLWNETEIRIPHSALSTSVFFKCPLWLSVIETMLRCFRYLWDIVVVHLPGVLQIFFFSYCSWKLTLPWTHQRLRRHRALGIQCSGRKGCRRVLRTLWAEVIEK